MTSMTDRRRRWLLFGGIVALALVLLVVVIVASGGGGGGHGPSRHEEGSGSTGSPSAYTSATPTTVPTGHVPPAGAHTQP